MRVYTVQLKRSLNLQLTLGINVPTGKDSLSMKQKYPDGDVVSPGTVIITAAGNCNAISKVVEPYVQTQCRAYLLHQYITRCF